MTFKNKTDPFDYFFWPDSILKAVSLQVSLIFFFNVIVKKKMAIDK
jgi:hypothetical protein